MFWDSWAFQKHLDPSGGRQLVRDEYGLYDNMAPKAAIVTEGGLTVAIYLTKPPTRTASRHDQEIHLVRLERPPDDARKVYEGRP